MIAYTTIPGIDGSDGQHRQTCWQSAWGASAENHSCFAETGLTLEPP